VTGARRPDRARLIRHIGFGTVLLGGVAVAGFIYLILAISECLPRDGSAEMLACDATKQREAWLFPLLFVLSAAGSIVLHWRGAAGAWLVAVASGVIAAIALIVINALLG
jgi:hypothetical protein